MEYCRTFIGGDKWSLIRIWLCFIICITATHAAWFHRSPRLYYFSDDDKKFFNAQEDCESKGANLVTINGDNENQFLHNSRSDNRQHWIGLYCILSCDNGNFQWYSGSSNYRNWASDVNTDNSGYAVIDSDNAKWKLSNNPDNQKLYICEKADGCQDPDRPCENGATCVADNSGGYTCICSAGFIGSYCETDINMCSSDPCVHGSCIDRDNRYTCDCGGVYTGQHCETDIDECAEGSHNCSDDVNECHTQNFCNHGACNNIHGGFLCTCDRGYEGDRCDQNIDECNRYHVICQNGGTCTDTHGSYECTCVPGHTGHNCSTETDECLSTPCLNGATCYDAFNNYSCACPPEFTGAHCENDIDECTLQIYCGQGQCTNTYGSFGCICPQGLGGVHCLDIDECLAERACNFHGNCTNHFGGFSCHCHDGFHGDSCGMTNNAPNRNTKTKADDLEFKDNLMAIVFISTSAFLFLLLCATAACFIVKRKQWMSRLKRQTQERSDRAEGIRDPKEVNVELNENDDARTPQMHTQNNEGDCNPYSYYTEVSSVPDKQELDAFNFYTKLNSKQK